VTWCVSFCFS